MNMRSFTSKEFRSKQAHKSQLIGVPSESIVTIPRTVEHQGCGKLIMHAESTDGLKVFADAAITFDSAAHVGLRDVTLTRMFPSLGGMTYQFWSTATEPGNGLPLHLAYRDESTEPALHVNFVVVSKFDPRDMIGSDATALLSSSSSSLSPVVPSSMPSFTRHPGPSHDPTRMGLSHNPYRNPLVQPAPVPHGPYGSPSRFDGMLHHAQQPQQQDVRDNCFHAHKNSVGASVVAKAHWRANQVIQDNASTHMHHQHYVPGPRQPQPQPQPQYQHQRRWH